MNVAEVYASGRERHGGQVAIWYEGREYTYADLHDQAGRMAAALRSLGVGVGDRVALVLPNCPDVTLLYDAIPRIGAVCVPMLFLLAPPEIGLICDDAEPKVLFTSPEFVDNVTRGLAGLANPPKVLVVGSQEYEHLLAEQEPDTGIVERAPDDLAVLVFTSGTTGRPKGVMLTHGNLRAQVDMVTRSLEYTPGEISLGVLPMAHLFGLAAALTAPVFGFRSVVHRWFIPEEFLAAVEQHRVTNTALVPTMLTLILNSPKFAETDLSSLQRVVVGAAPLPLELAQEWERRTRSRILQGYGMTETAAGAVIERMDRERKPGSVGLPYPGTEVAIMDDANRVLPPGEIGEICMKGAQITPGYWNDPEATAATIVDGWLHSGDVGYVDEDGYVYITERKKDLIIRGGLNIYPRDVEEVLYTHPAVAEAAVVGRPDARMGEQVVACVVLRPGAQAGVEDILAYCHERLAKYKTPSEVVLMEALPKTPVGKILKRDLRDLVARPPKD